MSNHTPGLWKVRKRMVSVIDSEAFVWDGNYIIFDGDVVIAEVSCDDVGTEQAEVNAKLIAAAPKMLEAIDFSIDLIAKGSPKTAMIILKEIAAKAKGETE